ncbi:MAG: hypothetical protein ABI591_02695 [Kofleriaceae bacterium]
MSRSLLLIPLLALTVGAYSCGKSASSQDKDTAGNAPEKVQFPDDPKGATNNAPNHNIPPPAGIGGVGGGSTLHADEGTMTIDSASGKVGAELTSNITVTPTSDFHVNVEFPTKVTLEAPDGVKLMKSELTAGGASKAQGDASAFSEKSLAFAIKATADKPGSYEIKGTMKFAVCKVDQCFPKKQAITITVAAN